MPAPAPTLQPDTVARTRIAISRLARRLRPTGAGIDAGLTPTRTSVLLSVVRNGPIRLSALADAEGLNPTMLSRAVSHLSDAGLIERTCDDGDRRAAWVEATDAGRELTERMRSERTDALNTALASLSASDRRSLEAALPALEQLAEELRDRRP